MAVPESPSERFGQLDGMRALAALTVFIGHCLGMLSPAPYSHGPVDWYLHSPLRIASGGHQAVIFFFLLSGFVLSLGFYKGKTSAAPFLLNRIFRLYPPYLCALLAVVIIRWLVPVQPMGELSYWINSFWLAPLKVHQVWPAVTMLADTQGPQLNPIAWSLIIEMRASLLFPIIMILLLRFGWRRGLVVALALGVLAALLSDSPTTLYATLQYGFFFVAGAVLAQHRAVLIGRCRSLSGPVQLSLLAVGVLLYTQVFWLAQSSRWHVQPVDDMVTALGATIFVVLALASPKASIVLPTALRRLGKGAYSFYLYHFVVLLTLANILYGHAPIWQIWLLALAATLLVSLIMYRAVEVPFIAAGHYFANRLKPDSHHSGALRTAA
ncbi:MAG: acyltransferase [Chloroflexi bacterium]|nr:MAG: acyltransferase [Chloroflexota bacterium]